MSMPVRNLPVVQNWDCQSCGNCCRELQVHISDEERRRIEDLGWDEVEELRGRRLFVRDGWWWARRTRLNHRPDGSCVFLGKGNRCLIHERGGPEAKPLACRLYPFVLAPAGSHWRVGLRFSCPSAADNEGRPLSERATELGQYTRLIEQCQDFEGANVPPPPLQRGQRVDWADLARFAQALVDLLEDRRDRVERRLRKCLALATLCRQARFDKVSGGRLVEFLRVVREELEREVPVDPADVPRPGWVGRVLFRQALNIYLRKGQGENRGPATRSRLAMFRAGWRFARGRGPVPRLNALIPETTFERIEAAADPLPESAQVVLERYYVVKVNSLQFCGPLNFDLGFWDGLASLALTFPATLWLARAVEGPREQAVARSLGVIDAHFGYNPVFRTRRLRFVQRTLDGRGELEKLIAWYGR
jgi:lysine-N-methylase